MKRVPEHLWVMFWVAMAGLTIATALTLSGCGDDCDLTTAPVVIQDDDDRDDGEGRDTLRAVHPWPLRPKKWRDPWKP